jgi:hypothetical protein
VPAGDGDEDSVVHLMRNDTVARFELRQERFFKVSALHGSDRDHEAN